MMEVCASGFAERRRSFFIGSGSALGVTNGWRVLMRIPNGGGFSLNAFEAVKIRMHKLMKSSQDEYKR
jgi:hypothetical protein